MHPAAMELRELMQSVSRQAYRQHWIEHLEYVLWYALVNGPMPYGRYQITQADLERLRRLSRACAGWVFVPRGGEPQWVPLAEWQDIFSRNIDLVTLG